MSCDLHFSIDLEDVRERIPDGYSYSERVPVNTERYLRFMEDHRFKATFFVVGKTAERYPGLINDIAAEGHELACHTSRHLQLDKQTPESLREDLERNLEVLHRCGAKEVVGFRAPTFSMIEKTDWAYEVIERLGFRYSSSVIPAGNPLYGWPGFGEEPRMVGGVLEMPLTLHTSPLRVPVVGGNYFRVLPFFFIRYGVRKLAGAGRIIQSYFHPYDIDTDQERFMHPDISGNRFYNALMYVGRAKVLSRLERLMEVCRFTDYRGYLERRGR